MITYQKKKICFIPTFNKVAEVSFYTKSRKRINRWLSQLNQKLAKKPVNLGDKESRKLLQKEILLRLLRVHLATFSKTILKKQFPITVLKSQFLRTILYCFQE